MPVAYYGESPDTEIVCSEILDRDDFNSDEEYTEYLTEREWFEQELGAKVSIQVLFYFKIS